MPTYDYQCLSCGTVTEVIHAMTATGPEACGSCGGKLRRVLFPTGIIFKGSGFYRTDSRAARDGSTGARASDVSKGTDAGTKAADSSSTPAPTEAGSSGSTEKPSTSEKT